MLKITLVDSISDYQTDNLNQWDSDQKLQVSGLTLANTPVVHFANKKSAKALVIKPIISSDTLTVQIPNSLLREPYPIFAYLYSYDNNSGQTVNTFCIPIVPRPQPDDYIFTGDSGFITMASINSKVDTLIKNTQSDYAAFKKAKTQEIDTLISTKDAELTQLKTDKTKELDDLKAAKDKELSDLKTTKTNELDTLKTAKTKEIDSLIQTKTTELDNLKSEKETAIDNLIFTKTQELDDLKTSKEAELDAVADQFIADVNANVVHDNLFINGDFKINQRGGTVYPNTNTWKYSVDRWKYIGLMTVTVNDDKTVTLAKEDNPDATYFVQTLENGITQNCTLSFEITAITGTLVVYLEGEDEEFHTYTEPGIYSFGSTKGTNAVVFRLDGTTTSVTLKWVKLEYGSIATPFYPRPYTEELRLCHYYYQVYDRAPIRSFSDDNTNVFFGFVLIDPIRKGAALTKTGLLNASTAEMDRSITEYNLNETTLINITFDTPVGTSGAYLSFEIDSEIY